MTTENEQKASIGPSRCARCFSDASRTGRASVDGRIFCSECVESLRRGVDAELDALPEFRCGLCGDAVGVQQMHELLGRLVCPACVAPASGDLSQERATATSAHAESVDVTHWPQQLLRRVTCPRCWHIFSPSEILWVSQHADLVGDPIAGPDAQLRFRASRFNDRGEALDLRDMRCQHLACPQCHLEVPRLLLEHDPLILSIIGAPASGKSHLLAAMTWELRRLLPKHFGMAFLDADPDLNRCLNEYEETLFLPADTEQLVAIRKTELQGELYDQIRVGQQVVTLPRPFLFMIRRSDASVEAAARVRLLCMYDNAGEHFQPGMDTAAAPGTQHLAKSQVLMFLFDPTQHPRLREHCRTISDDPQLQGPGTSQRQETILLEAVTRVRRHAGLSANQKHDKPLLVLVSKADVWAPLAGIDLEQEPVVRAFARVAGSDDKRPVTAIDLGRVERMSDRIRAVLVEHAPNLVTAAEDSFERVTYLPVSALGAAPCVDQRGMLAIRSRDVRPRWVTVPLLYVLGAAPDRGIPAVRSKPPPAAAEQK